MREKNFAIGKKLFSSTRFQFRMIQEIFDSGKDRGKVVATGSSFFLASGAKISAALSLDDLADEAAASVTG